jgi:prepilin-type N-terminal cleavage/methylation domain-containing protein
MKIHHLQAKRHSSSNGETLKFPSWRSRTRALAFSLIELLTVIAIVSILAAVSIPAITSLNRSGNINNTILKVSLQLEQARSYAMAHNTYVWVGFAQDSNKATVSMAIMASKTGQKSDLTQPNNQQFLTKVQTFEQTGLTKASQWSSQLPDLATDGDDVTESLLGSFQQTSGTKTYQFTKVMQFSPGGDVSIAKASGRSRSVQIGLQPLYGSTKKQEANVAAFQVAGLSGQVNIFRP